MCDSIRQTQTSAQVQINDHNLDYGLERLFELVKVRINTVRIKQHKKGSLKQTQWTKKIVRKSECLN